MGDSCDSFSKYSCDSSSLSWSIGTDDVKLLLEAGVWALKTDACGVMISDAAVEWICGPVPAAEYGDSMLGMVPGEAFCVASSC